MIPLVRKVYQAAQWWTTPLMPGAHEVVEALANWAAGVVPEGCTAVMSDAGITITCGTSNYQSTILITPTLRDVEPHEVVLERALQVFAVAFQRNMLRMTDNKAWPDEGAAPHCAVTVDKLYVWWGGPTRRDALVEVPPILRLDCG